MIDTNECRLTGTIHQINPKTGAAMAEIILKVRRDRFRVLVNGNVAEHLLSACSAGDRLTVTGTLSVSSWRDESSQEWHNGFAVTAWGAEVHGDKIAFQEKRSK